MSLSLACNYKERLLASICILESVSFLETGTQSQPSFIYKPSLCKTVRLTLHINCYKLCYILRMYVYRCAVTVNLSS